MIKVFDVDTSFNLKNYITFVKEQLLVGKSDTGPVSDLPQLNPSCN